MANMVRFSLAQLLEQSPKENPFFRNLIGAKQKKPICAKCIRIFCRIKTFRSAVENDAVERWYKRSSSDIYNIATNYVTPVGVLYDLQVTYESSYCSNCSRITFPHFTLHTYEKKDAVALGYEKNKIIIHFAVLKYRLWVLQ